MERRPAAGMVALIIRMNPKLEGLYRSTGKWILAGNLKHAMLLSARNIHEARSNGFHQDLPWLHLQQAGILLRAGFADAALQKFHEHLRGLTLLERASEAV